MSAARESSLTRALHAEHTAGPVTTEVDVWLSTLPHPLPPGEKPRAWYRVILVQRVGNNICLTATLYEGPHSSNAMRVYEEAASGAELLALEVNTAATRGA